MSRFLKDKGKLTLEKTTEMYVTGKDNTWYYIKSYLGQDKICLAKRMLLGQLAKSELKLWLTSPHTDSTLADMVTIPKTCWTFCSQCHKHQPTKRHSPRSARSLSILHRKRVMTGSRVAMVDRLSWFSRERLKPQRRFCRGLNALSPIADLRECWLLRYRHVELGGHKKRKIQSDSVLSFLFCFIMKIIKSWDYGHLKEKTLDQVTVLLWC